MFTIYIFSIYFHHFPSYLLVCHFRCVAFLGALSDRPTLHTTVFYHGLQSLNNSSYDSHPIPLTIHIRFLLRFTSNSSYDSHPIPLTIHIRFLLRFTSNSSYDSHPIPLTIHIRFLLRFTSDSSYDSHPIPLTIHIQFLLRFTSDSSYDLHPIPLTIHHQIRKSQSYITLPPAKDIWTTPGPKEFKDRPITEIQVLRMLLIIGDVLDWCDATICFKAFWDKMDLIEPVSIKADS